MTRKPSRPQPISALSIAGAYIGTVVGAGFASGQEVLQFFGFFGRAGMLGLGISAALFITFGLLILEAGRRLKATSHIAVVRYAGGPYLGRLIDIVITFFLFGALTAMVAGAGAVFREQFGLSPLFGHLFMASAAALTVLSGLGRVVTAISLVVPFLIGSVLWISVNAILQNPAGVTGGLALPQPERAAVPHWALSGVAYASYNLVLSAGVLGPVGSLARSQAAVTAGALLGGTGLGLGALAIHLAILANAPESFAFEVPLVFIATTLSPAFKTAFSIVLLGEIYTTAVANLYAFGARLYDPEARLFGILVLAASFIALLAARLGFSTLVRIVYPAVGYAGFAFMAALAYRAVRDRLT